MARIYTCGFEWQSLTAGVEVTGVNGTPTISTAIKHSGAASMEVSGSIAGGAAEDCAFDIAATTKIYVRYYLYVDTLTDDNTEAVPTFFDLYNSATNVVSIQFFNDAGTLNLIVYYNDFGATLTDSTTINFDTWYRIEILYDSTPVNGSEVLTVKIDGVEVASATNLTFTLKSITSIDWGVFNGQGGAVTDCKVHWDDIVINNTSGTDQVSYPGEGNIVIAVPTGAGDNAADAGTASMIAEIPPSDTATTGVTMIELDTTTSIGDYAMTDSSTAGIDSYDTITLVSVLARVREEAAGTSNYTLRIKSASGGSVQASSSVDGGNATPRTNPASTVAFSNPLVAYVDPDTAVAWTPTGTNSIDNMQCGAATTDGTPDIWVLTLAAMIEYVDGVAPGGEAVKDVILSGGGIIPFAR